MQEYSKNKVLDYLEVAFYFAVISILIIRIIIYSKNSLQLDELATVVMVEPSLWNTYLNTTRELFSSWAYTPLLSILMRFSSSEAILRLPSLIFILAGMYFCFLTFVEIGISKKVAIRTLAIFICSSFAFLAATTVRPYGIATFFLSGSYFLFTRLIHHRNSHFIVVVFYIIFTSIIPYLHLIYVINLVPQFIYFLIASRSLNRLKIILCWTTIGALLLPIGNVISKVVSSKELVPIYTLQKFFDVIFPSYLMLAIIIPLIASAFNKSSAIFNNNTNGFFSFEIKLIFISILLPTILLLAQMWTNSNLLLNRYIPFSSITLSLAASIGSERIKGLFMRLYFLSLFFLVAYPRILPSFETLEDWRQAIQEMNIKLDKLSSDKNSNPTILLSSGHIETISESFLRENQQSRALAGPLLFYSKRISSKPLPPHPSYLKKMSSYEEEVIDRSFHNFSTIPLLCRNDCEEWLKWFDDKCTQNYGTLTNTSYYGQVLTTICLRN